MLGTEVNVTSTLKPRDFGGILSETFRIYGRNFLILLGIVAIVQVILIILGYVLTLPPIMSGETIESPGLFTLMVIILLAGLIVGTPLMEGSLIHAISEQHFRQPIYIGQAYRFTWQRLKVLIGATILAGLAIFGMAITIIGIPFAIYFGIRWAFILQIVLLEGLSARDALSRSSELVKLNWWRVFGIMLVVGIIIGVANFILDLILSRIHWVLSAIGGILTAPIFVIVITLLYYDLRVRKEGYTIEKLAEELLTCPPKTDPL